MSLKFIMLVEVKMPTAVGILTFINRIIIQHLSVKVIIFQYHNFTLLYDVTVT